MLSKSFYILLISEKKGDQALHVETIHGTLSTMSGWTQQWKNDDKKVKGPDPCGSLG